MLHMIVACDKNYGIGYKGELLFRLPEDMQFFKDITLEHTVVMGRNTFESINSKPLKNRENVVISSDTMGILSKRNDIIVVHPEDAVSYVINTLNAPDKEIFIIGGAQVYNMFLPMCDHIYLTRYYKEFRSVDTFFPRILVDEFTILTTIKKGVYNGYAWYIEECVRK